MLAINKATNTAVVLHGITKFYPSIGFQQGTHLATGTTIALMGEAPYPGALPQVVTVPQVAFEDAQMWAAATDAMIEAANPTDQLIQLDNHHTMSMACIIPIPPNMAPLFLENANATILNLTQLVKMMYDMAAPNTRQMCALPVQFLQAATIAAPPTVDTMESQLAIPLAPLTMDQTITQWATARYSFYHMLPKHQHTPNTS